MKPHEIKIEEELRFYQAQGFPDTYIYQAYISDLIIPPDNTSILVEEEDYLPEKTISIFLGKQEEDGDPSWRLRKVDYIHIISENRRHIVSADLLQDFIETNNLHVTNRIKTRGASIVVRIPISWIVYGLQPDIQTFTRPGLADEIQTIQGFKPLCFECGSESSVDHAHSKN